MQQYALIVAGGKGERMKSELPKQFMDLSGKPMLMHTIKVFSRLDIQIIVALPEESIAYWNTLCRKFDFSIPHKVIRGGFKRFDSVKNGLDLIPEDSYIAIHDGARPLVTETLVSECFHQAALHQSAIPCLPPSESIMMLKDFTFISVNREQFRLVQTPQTFLGKMIKEAYQNASHHNFTDDASVFEANGSPVHVIDGERENIKITCPLDFRIAETILEMRRNNSTV